MKTHTFFKSLMTTILFLLIPWEGKATGLSGDVIYLQEEEWVLLDKPINRDSILFHRLMEFLPENHCITTANWEGYTAYWEVQQSHLYLHHLEVCVYDEQKKEEYLLTYLPDQLKEVFQPYYQDGEKFVPAGSTGNCVPEKVNWYVMYTAASTAIWKPSR